MMILLSWLPVDPSFIIELLEEEEENTRITKNTRSFFHFQKFFYFIYSIYICRYRFRNFCSWEKLRAYIIGEDYTEVSFGNN